MSVSQSSGDAPPVDASLLPSNEKPSDNPSDEASQASCKTTTTTNPTPITEPARKRVSVTLLTTPSATAAAASSSRQGTEENEEESDTTSDFFSDSDEDDDTTVVPEMLSSLSPELCESAKLLSRNTLCRIHRLAQVIRSGAYVVMVTGAGVSVASGIRTYRSGKDGLWNNYVYEWGTKRKFLSDPSGWYTNFWLKAHNPEEFLNAKPGASHVAIAQIMKFVLYGIYL